MKKSLSIGLLVAFGLLPASVPNSFGASASEGGGQTAKPVDASGVDESDRLMQEYMARRAEWVALRQAAFDRAAAAKTDGEKRQVIAKLADDEKALLERMGAAAGAYRAVRKQKQDAAAANKPRG